VPHRLEPIAEVGGVTYVNDSIATTPERTVAGMRAFDEPVVLLLGGREKHLPLGELTAEIARRCRAVVTFGEAAELFARAARDAGTTVAVRSVEDVASAVREAAALARPGDVVLFSPAGTSFDAYRNFERRGRAFRDAVESLGGGT
jgi:UDP-N-acetylmuramoylalanine--D-glutamate ligase